MFVCVCVCVCVYWRERTLYLLSIYSADEKSALVQLISWRRFINGVSTVGINWRFTDSQTHGLTDRTPVGVNRHPKTLYLSVNYIQFASLWQNLKPILELERARIEDQISVKWLVWFECLEIRRQAHAFRKTLITVEIIIQSTPNFDTI